MMDDRRATTAFSFKPSTFTTLSEFVDEVRRNPELAARLKLNEVEIRANNNPAHTPPPPPAVVEANLTQQDFDELAKLLGSKCIKNIRDLESAVNLKFGNSGKPAMQPVIQRISELQKRNKKALREHQRSLERRTQPRLRTNGINGSRVVEAAILFTIEKLKGSLETVKNAPAKSSGSTRRNARKVA